MSRAIVFVCLACFGISFTLPAQVPADTLAAFPAMMAVDSEPDPMGGGGGGGQTEYHAWRGDSFSRLGFGAAFSTLGIGAELATNAGPRMDLRVFGNYTNLTHNFTRSGFHIGLNIGMANAGAKVDLYPLHRIPLRISPGFLYFNQNRLSAGLHAETGATFTINNVDYASDSTNPVYGTGSLKLGGPGFIATAGLGHFVSHSYKRFSFPFEAGVVFINTPVAQFNLFGKVCSVSEPRFCQPAAQFPEFETNLHEQVVTWNHTVAPYHIYPIAQIGFAYTFNLPGRGVR